jgi:hypothetical protein
LNNSPEHTDSTEEPTPQNIYKKGFEFPLDQKKKIEKVERR